MTTRLSAYSRRRKNIKTKDEETKEILRAEADAGSPQDSVPHGSDGIISMTKRKSCALRPDAQAFDEIRIVTVPRYKQSGLSGDEWRIHAEVEFYRKGKLIFSEGCRNTQTAAGLLYSFYMRACDDGKGYFAGDGVTCDQEGCHEPVTTRYRRLAEYCNSGHKTDVSDVSLYRHFCEKHKTRGDCAFDDADRNYVEEPMLGEELTDNPVGAVR